MKSIVTLSSLLFICLCVEATTNNRGVIDLSEKNWTVILENEWMVEFFAPWCPACRNLAPAWKSFADHAEDMNIGVAAVDITQNPALSGIFFVASLPTIYHVKNGEFRLYEGGRSVNEFQRYVSSKAYLNTEALPWYVSPGSFHMRAFGQVISMCLKVKDLHGYFVETMGLPSWAAYVILGSAMLIFGVVFGLMFVVCCDYLFPPRVHLSASGGLHKPPRSGPSESMCQSAETHSEEEDADLSSSEDDTKQPADRDPQFHQGGDENVEQEGKKLRRRTPKADK